MTMTILELTKRYDVYKYYIIIVITHSSSGVGFYLTFSSSFLLPFTVVYVATTVSYNDNRSCNTYQQHFIMFYQMNNICFNYYHETVEG